MLTAGAIVANRFQLGRQLGQGGMGAVWSATHTVTGKTVALKFLSGPSEADDDSRRRLLREARAACSVRHPNVVQVHDVLELEGGAPVLVMDLLEGESLGDRLERQTKLPPDELVRLVVPMVSALEAAHARGVIHRDIKPDNVFLANRPDGSVDVKVLDFGIAKVTKLDESSQETAKLTGTGAMMGTPYYMAPEQVYGERDLDARTDLWATGVLMYEGLAGVRPSEGANLGQILKLVTLGPFKPLLEAAPSTPPALARIVEACLERDRGRRIASARELRETLERFLAGNTFDGAALPAVEPPPPTREPVRSVHRGRRALIVAAALVLAGAAGGFAWLAPTRHGAPVGARAIAPASPAPPSPPAPVESSPPTNAAPQRVGAGSESVAGAVSAEPSKAPAPEKPGARPPARREPAPKSPIKPDSDRTAGGVVAKPPF